MMQYTFEEKTIWFNESSPLAACAELVSWMDGRGEEWISKQPPVLQSVYLKACSALRNASNDTESN